MVQCTTLGRWGRFGNQLLQYAFARAYAERHGAVLEVPDWIGRRLFGLDDPYPSRELPRCELDVIPWGQVDVDLFGYFQKEECTAILSRAVLRRWFTIGEAWRGCVTLPERPYIAAHLRRGDYQTSGYCVVRESSYLRACERFGLPADRLVWVSEEAPRPGPEPALDFLADFLVLLEADVILRANSTFSFWAGVLGRGRVFSPLVDGLVGWHDVEFVEGNWPRCVDCCDNLHIPE